MYIQYTYLEMMTLVIIVGVKISIFHLFTLRRTHILGTGRSILYFSTVHLNVKKKIAQTDIFATCEGFIYRITGNKEIPCHR